MECCCPSTETDSLPEVEIDRLYPRESVTRTKTCAIFNFIFALVPMVVMVNGVAEVSSQTNTFFSAGRGVLSWSRTHVEGTRQLLTLNDTSDPFVYVRPIQEAFFTTFHSQVDALDASLTSLENAMSGFFDDVSIFALVVALLPVGFLLITALSAVMDWRRNILCINSLLHYIVIIGYGLGGFLFLSLGMFMGDLCGERTKYLANINDPGLIAWWAVPDCTAKGYFNTSKDNLEGARGNRSLSSCTGLLQICDQLTTYTAATNKAYRCGNLSSTNLATCADYSTALATQAAAAMKLASPVRCENGTVNPSFLCPVDDCGEYCNDATTQAWAANASVELDHAGRVDLSLQSHVAPISNCSELFFQMLTPLSNCNRLAGAFFQVGAGSFAFTILFVSGLFVIWRGQKRFFKPEPLDEEESDDHKSVDDEDSDNEPFSPGGTRPDNRV